MVVKENGTHSLLPRDKMAESARRMRDFYNIVPGASFVQKEFGFYVLDRWRVEGHIPVFTDTSQERKWLVEKFGYDEPGSLTLGGVGGCEAEFAPQFEDKVLEDRGEYELVQDFAGRSVLCFKGRRSGFMPEYVDHPVKDRRSWEKNVVWRMDPHTPSRYAGEFKKRMALAREYAGQGKFIIQLVVGGFMYLRSLVGPLELLYMFHDQPKLIHDCMRAWYELADAVIARHQEHISLDALFLSEDICYNHGSLISPDMMREFLMPYYQQLITNCRMRQLDKERKLFIQVDTDGYCVPVIDIYRREIGLDFMSPFEVASGCDVVKIGSDYPWLCISGGIDKRILAQSKEAIGRMLERILPPMRRRGGYLPTCDHGVPEEVSFENYMHYRQRMLEYNN